METLTIELKKDKSMALLEDLEALDIIKIIRKKTPPKPPGKLSDVFRGSISIEEGEALKNIHNKLETNGNEIFKLSY